MKETIGFIGLGDLGQPMARMLLQAGYPLRVYNRTANKAEALVALGAEAVTRPSETLIPGGIVVSVVADDAALESVVMSEGFLASLGPSSVHLSMSTVSPALSQKLAALHAEHESQYVEAPVFGRPEAAAARQLWICVAGPTTAKERVQPLLDALGQGSFDFGEGIGSALTVKLVGNFLILSAAGSMAEALTLAQQNGVDPTRVIEMLTQTLFTDPIYQNYGRMIARDPGALSLGWIPLKDVGLYRELALRVGVETPLASVMQHLLQPDITRG